METLTELDTNEECVYSKKNTEKIMQPDEFRFLGSLNYCLKRFSLFYYYYVNFNLFKISRERIYYRDRDFGL